MAEKLKYKVGDKVTVVRILYWNSSGNPQDIHRDTIKSIVDGKITLRSGLIFNKNGYRVKDMSTFIKEIRYNA